MHKIGFEVLTAVVMKEYYLLGVSRGVSVSIATGYRQDG
jgi:hypothetical protein